MKYLGKAKFHKQSRLPMMVMLEITNRCNMKCPVCFANADRNGNDLSLAEISDRLDIILSEVGCMPIQISGGEPTLHKQLPEVIKIVRKKGFKNIELVTNGIAISRNQEYLMQLVENGLTAVYLQFDGLTERTHQLIRGQDMREVRFNAVSSVRGTGICCTLAVALIPGVNENEIGDIIQFGVDNIDTVRAINFQAATRFQGRFIDNSDQAAMPLSQLISSIETQGDLVPGGFSGDILGHPDCNAMSILYVVDGKLKPLFNHLNMEKVHTYLGKNKREKILGLFEGKKKYLGKLLFNPKVWPLMMDAHSLFDNKLALNSLLRSQHILLFAKSFMGCNSFDTKRLQKCNYGIVGNDGIYSFCAFNNFYRNTTVEQT